MVTSECRGWLTNIFLVLKTLHCMFCFLLYFKIQLEDLAASFPDAKIKTRIAGFCPSSTECSDHIFKNYKVLQDFLFFNLCSFSYVV